MTKLDSRYLDRVLTDLEWNQMEASPSNWPNLFVYSQEFHLSGKNKVGGKLKHCCSEWPDWAILQLFGNKLSHKSSPNILVTFWAIFNNVSTFYEKVYGYFLGNFLLGNFLFHHLVTLTGHVVYCLRNHSFWCLPVWPDLAKFCHFGNIFSLGQFFEGLFTFWENLGPWTTIGRDIRTKNQGLLGE